MTNRTIPLSLEIIPVTLLGELCDLINDARQRVAATVNSELTLLPWRMGMCIDKQVLSGQRAQYRKEIWPTLSAASVQDCGRGFNEKNLRRMVQFAEVFPEESIVVTLSRQLGWSHFFELIPLKLPLR